MKITWRSSLFVTEDKPTYLGHGETTRWLVGLRLTTHIKDLKTFLTLCSFALQMLSFSRSLQLGQIVVNVFICLECILHPAQCMLGLAHG